MNLLFKLITLATKLSLLFIIGSKSSFLSKNQHVLDVSLYLKVSMACNAAATSFVKKYMLVSSRELQEEKSQ